MSKNNIQNLENTSYDAEDNSTSNNIQVLLQSRPHETWDIQIHISIFPPSAIPPYLVSTNILTHFHMACINLSPLWPHLLQLKF